jgi:uncharacterized membrane protein
MPKWLIPIGRCFYAIGLIGIGVQHFIFSDFIPVIMPGWPAWIPGGHAVFAYIFGALLISAGACILFDIKGRIMAALTGAVFLLLVIVAHLPVTLALYPWHLGSWTNAFKLLTMCGGAWMVVGSLDDRSSQRISFLEPIMPVGRYFLPITVIAFGYAHFLYVEFVQSLVPAWIPGHVFWTYLAGVALIAAGLGIIFRVQARLAAFLLGLMIFLWFILLHIPRAIADPHSGKGNEWTSVFEALAFSGIAFIMAALPASSRFSISRSD